MEIYISTDVETDGPIPGPHSMLSFGSAAYKSNKELISTFEANLKTLPGATGHPSTMAWWKTQPEAWSACRENPRNPKEVMFEYNNWIYNLCTDFNGNKVNNPVFVGYPASFDFLFMYWYLIYFTGESPFSFSALDIKTYAMAVLKTEYRKSTKKNMPSRWFDKLPHNHVALSDSIEQGALFINMLNYNNKNIK